MDTEQAANEGLIELLISDQAGIYVPKKFCDSYSPEDWNADTEDWDICQSGPDHEHYWEAWYSLLSDCYQTDGDGNKWALYQDGDLWAFRVDADIEW